MATNTQYEAQLAGFDKQAEDYIGQLIDQAGGDKDFAIKILTRDHNLAIGANDAQTASFLEKVSDKLEEKIGRIPYDYEINTKRLEEDRARTVDVANRNKDLALSRLAEDENVWRKQFREQSTEAKQSQAEELSKRGLVQGTREQAQGLAGREVGKLESNLQDTLSAYDRALGRNKADINTQAGDIIFGAERTAKRGKADEGTIARRGVIDAQDKFNFGKESEQRRFDTRKKELERQLANLKLQGTTYATQGVV